MSAKWTEAFALMIHGEDDEGNDVHQTIEPFRTKEVAEKYAKLKFRGFDHSILFTMIPPGTRCVGLPRKKKK